MYNDTAFSRLQNILLFRELEFPLKEIKAKWGNTKAYQEYKQKDIARNGDSYNKIANELMTMFSELGELKHFAPNSDEVQKKISVLQKIGILGR